MEAVKLIEALMSYLEANMQPADIAYCRDILASEPRGQSHTAALTKYLFSATDVSNGMSDFQALSNHMEYYLALHEDLLFSYGSGDIDSDPIPAKYYAPMSGNYQSLVLLLPAYSMVIKAKRMPENFWYGANEAHKGNLVDLKLYRYHDQTWSMLYDGSFIDAYYPRFSKFCHQPCSANNPKGLHQESLVEGMQGGWIECLLSAKQMSRCRREQAVKEAYGLNLLDCYAMAMMCFDRWVSRPLRKGTRKETSYQDLGVSVIGAQFVETSAKTSLAFREVRLQDYTAISEEMTRGGWSVRDRRSPGEHERRAHTRRLRSGKIVTVRAAIINKGKGRNIHEIV